MKSQIGWIPLAVGAVRLTQGRTIAVMQVSGGSQSFNALNRLRVLERWMRIITIPNESSVSVVAETRLSSSLHESALIHRSTKMVENGE
jgi:arsenical resistance protein ArsH